MPDFADTKPNLRGTTDILGTATAASGSGLCLVSFGGTIITCNVIRGLTIASGDVVLVGRTGAKWWIKGIAYATSPTPPTEENKPAPAPPPKPPTKYGTLVVAPVETRSYRTTYGWRSDNDDVYQGQYGGYGNHTGCAFYGNKPASLAGSVVMSATLRVKRLTGGDYGANTSTLRRITNKTKPGGAPSFYSTGIDGPRLSVNKTNTAFTIPTSWAQDLVDGNAGGLAIYESDGDPYMRFAGRQAYSSAWTLTINWRRD